MHGAPLRVLFQRFQPEAVEHAQCRRNLHFVEGASCFYDNASTRMHCQVTPANVNVMSPAKARQLPLLLNLPVRHTSCHTTVLMHVMRTLDMWAMTPVSECVTFLTNMFSCTKPHVDAVSFYTCKF
jgi:hypothetical protein